MNIKKSKGYVFPAAIAVIGTALFAASIVLMILFAEPQGIMKTLPYIFLGVGAGALGGGIGGAYSSHILRKNPGMAKQKEINSNDERNIAIMNKAKAKVFNYTWMLFSALLIIFTMMQVKPSVIFVLAGAYLSVIVLFICLLHKYQKEM